MDQSIIALLALLLSSLVGTVGGFAYISGEMRKIATIAKCDTDRLRDIFITRLDSIAVRENAERSALRGELTGMITNIESELRAITERAVRRSDLDAVESRLTRGNERANEKIDILTSRVTELLGNYNSGQRTTFYEIK